MTQDLEFRFVVLNFETLMSCLDSAVLKTMIFHKDHEGGKSNSFKT